MEVTAEDIIVAFGKSVKAYLAAERTFADDPSAATAGPYLRAIDRLIVLRDETRQSIRLANALRAEEVEPVICEAVDAIKASIESAREAAA